VTTSNLTNIIQEKRGLEARFEREFFTNIGNEFVKVIEISYHQPTNITNNVFDFGNFTRKKMKERSLDFDFFFVGSITPSDSGNVTLNVTVINLLNKPINATLKLNSSSPANYSEIVDSSQWSTNYSLTQGNNYILTIGYNGTYEENITINTRINQSVYVGFFDISLIGSKATYKDNFQKSYYIGSTSLPPAVPTTSVGPH
jgi:hypothetical protein